MLSNAKSDIVLKFHTDIKLSLNSDYLCTSPLMSTILLLKLFLDEAIKDELCRFPFLLSVWQ